MATREKKQQGPSLGSIATLEQLLAVSQSLIEVHDLDNLLQQIAESAGTVLGADIVKLYEYNRESGDVAMPPVTWGNLQYPDPPSEKRREPPEPDSALFKALIRGEPFFAPEVTRDWGKLVDTQPQKLEMDSFVRREGIYSSAVVPLAKGQEKVGVLFVSYRRPRGFRQRECKTIELFATQAAIAIANTRSLERQFRRHRILHQVGNQLAGQLDERQILDTVAAGAVETMNCTHCSVFRREGDQLVIEAVKGDWERTLIRGRFFQVGQGLAGWVAEHGESALVSNSHDDERFERNWSPGFPDPLSLVVVPIYLESSHAYSIISVEHNLPGMFDASDLQLVETLAQQAAQAVRNARLFTTLHKMDPQPISLQRAVQEQPVDQVFHHTVEGINAILGDGTSSSINRYDAETDEFGPSYACGPLKKFLEVPPRPNGTGRHVLRTGQLLYLDDVRHPPTGEPTIRTMSTRPDIASFAALPLKTADQLVGVLFVNLEKAVALSQERGITRLLELFANQAAISIQNAHLYEERMATLDDTYRAAVTKGLGEVTKLVVDQALKTVGGEYAEIWLCGVARDSRTRQGVGDEMEMPQSAMTDELVLAAASGPARKAAWQVGRLPMSAEHNVNVRVSRTGQAYVCSNIQDSTEFEHTLATARSCLTVPLKQGNEIVGTVNVESSHTEAFDNQSLVTLADQARFVAIAVDAARLYEDVEQWADELSALTEVAGRVGLAVGDRQVLDTVSKAARHALNAVRCTLFLTNDGGELVPHAAEGVPLSVVQEYSFKRGYGLAGWVAEHGRRLLIPDTEQDPRYVPVTFRDVGSPRCMVLAPIWIGHDIVGVISADRDEVNAFSERDALFLETLAMQAGIAIQHARAREKAIRTGENPYAPSRTSHTPDAFFGREALAREITTGMYRNNFIICGEHGVGKTALLWHLVHQLRALSARDPQHSFLPVYTSLQGISQDRFFGHIMDCMSDASGIDRPIATDQTKPHGPSVFGEHLRSIFANLLAVHPGRDVHVVLLIDEMDQFIAYDSAIQQQFRAVLNAPWSGHLQAIMTGETLDRVRDAHTSPWYNLFLEVTLDALNEKEARQLLTRPVLGLYAYEADAIETILFYSSRKPRQIGRLAYYSVRAMLARMLPMVDELDQAEPATATILLEDVLDAVDRMRERESLAPAGTIHSTPTPPSPPTPSADPEAKPRPNPYIIGPPVDKDDFYGRQQFLEELLNFGDHCSYLLGNRRSGKTSLLRCIRDTTQEVALYLDLCLLDTGGHATTLSAILGHYVLDQARQHPALQNLALEPAADVCSVVQMLTVAATAAGLRIVLLWDEAEKLLDLEDADLQRLRATMQHARSLRLVLAATRHLFTELKRRRGPATGAPFLSDFVMHHIPPLTPKEAADLIRQTAHPEGSVTVDPAVLADIQARTGNHPYLIQRLCRQLFQPHGELRPVNDWDVVVDSGLADIFEIDYQTLTDGEQTILDEIWQKGLADEVALLHALRLDPTTLQAGLLELQKLGYIAKDNDQWRVANTFLANWLGGQHMPPSSVPLAPPVPLAYSLADVSDLLLNSLTASDLRRLFLISRNPDLHRLHAELAPSISLAELVDQVVELCSKRVLMPDLLKEVESIAPRQYAIFVSRLES